MIHEKELQEVKALKCSSIYITDLSNNENLKDNQKRSYFNLKRQNTSQIRSKGFILKDIPDNDPVSSIIEVTNIASRLQMETLNFCKKII